MQTPDKMLRIVARSADQGDKIFKVPNPPEVAVRYRKEFANSQSICKVKKPYKRPHSPAQPRESVGHQPVLYPDTVSSFGISKLQAWAERGYKDVMPKHVGTCSTASDGRSISLTASASL